MKLITKPIHIDELKKIADKKFGNLVKAVVDVEKKVMVVDAAMHADEEAYLIKKGSLQDNVWGINLYPGQEEDFIEFDSIINLRPKLDNLSRAVEDPKLQERIKFIVNSLILR